MRQPPGREILVAHDGMVVVLVDRVGVRTRAYANRFEPCDTLAQQPLERGLVEAVIAVPAQFGH